MCPTFPVHTHLFSSIFFFYGKEKILERLHVDVRDHSCKLAIGPLALRREGNACLHQEALELCLSPGSFLPCLSEDAPTWLWGGPESCGAPQGLLWWESWWRWVFGAQLSHEPLPLEATACLEPLVQRARPGGGNKEASNSLAPAVVLLLWHSTCLDRESLLGLSRHPRADLKMGQGPWGGGSERDGVSRTSCDLGFYWCWAKAEETRVRN